MSNRSRSKRDRRPRHPAANTDASGLDEMPRPLRLVLESQTQFAEFLSDSSSPAEFVKNVETEVRTAAARIVELAEPFDVLDVLADIHLGEVLHDPDTFRETEHEGHAAVIEVVAICLGCRGRRAGTLPSEGGMRPRPDGVIDEISTTARRLISIGSLLSVARAIEASPDGLASVSLGATLREVHVRNLSYPHMEAETTAALFGQDIVARDCQEAMGCTATDIQAVFEAMVDLQGEAWQGRFETMAEFVNLAGSEMRLTEARRRSNPREETTIDPAVKARASALFEAAWGNPADTGTLDDETVANRAGVTSKVVATVRVLASHEMALGDPGDAVLAFLQGSNPLRDRPLLRADDGAIVPVHSGLLLPSVRPIAEARLKDAGRWKRYEKCRRTFLENQGVLLLSRLLPSADVHQGYEYYVPDPAASEAETAPATYSKLVEGDGLLIVDDIAIVVEAKAGSFSAPSRRGSRSRLVTDLRKIITDAAAQADRTRERILADGGLRLRDESWLDLSYVREVHTVALSLDDLSGIATITSELVAAGLLPSARLPWTVSLHDLRVVSEVIERPAEFLLYLRRRTERDLTVLFRAVDELDFFVHFLDGQLYVEPDPARVQAELPQLGDPTVRSKRRRVQQPVTMITSKTDVLDAWYAYQLGEREVPAPKPAMSSDPAVQRLVDLLANRANPGWLSAGVTLLDGDEPTQRAVGRHADDLVRMTRADGRGHSMTRIGGASAASSFALVWATQGDDETARQTRSRIDAYLRLKKHQAGVARGFAFVFDIETQLVETMFDNRVPGPDPKLDALLPVSGLKPIEQSTRALRPRGGRSGRVTPKKGR